MNEAIVSNLVEIYMPKLDVARNAYPHSKATDVLKEFSCKVKLLKGVEGEIESYLKESISLVWIGSKEGIDFISRACDSAVERIADMAKYWSAWIADDDDDDSE
ncbi:hypothetical protein [Clostridium sp. YIM B02555]|uniref:hypothetical protein n=1 Tax=Clostridium sp. YIM B02555 TaxID=2911968 RepID=UPI001EED4F63|nr:hypothetical protein [Clostridium sp. YIM B02555]